MFTVVIREHPFRLTLHHHYKGGIGAKLCSEYDTRQLMTTYHSSLFLALQRDFFLSIQAKTHCSTTVELSGKREHK